MRSLILVCALCSACGDGHGSDKPKVPDVVIDPGPPFAPEHKRKMWSIENGVAVVYPTPDGVRGYVLVLESDK